MPIVIVRDTSRQRMHDSPRRLCPRTGADSSTASYTPIVEADAIDHYEPIYSINETGWWLHRR
jgi:hypothetical protein